MISDFFSELIRMSIMGSVGILIILILKKCFGRHLSPKAHLYIWLPVIVKLTIPYTPQSKFSVYNLLPSYEPEAFPVPSFIPVTQTSQCNILLLLWAAGASATLLLCLLSYLRFYKHLDKCSEKPNGLEELSQKAAALCKLKRSPAITVCKNNISPMTVGLLKPRIILPQKILYAFDEKQLLLILTHEYIHLKKRDHLFNLFLLALNSIYWFHPLVRLMSRAMKHDNENVCDERVLKLFSEENQYLYSKTILELAACTKERSAATSVSPMASTGRTLKNRLKTIYSFSRKKLTVAILPVCIMISVLFLTGAIEKEISPSVNAITESIEAALSLPSPQPVEPVNSMEPQPSPAASRAPSLSSTLQPASPPPAATEAPAETKTPVPTETSDPLQTGKPAEPIPTAPAKEKVYVYQSNHAVARLSKDRSKAGFSCNTGELSIRTNRITSASDNQLEGYFTIARNGEIIRDNVKGSVSASVNNISFSAGSEHRYSFELLKKTIE